MSVRNNEQRVIRVFISSTFRDMQAERDELIKYIFPQLRSLCESRGVVWGEVDLRWGITDEEKAEGKVLPLCLEEIKNCRPYFIGLLGERYGWVPDDIPSEIIEREPWLKEHLAHSVTELEILQGVLRNPEMADHAFFYFRDPSYIEKLSEEKKTDFIEEEADQKEKLQSLKDRIRKSGFPVRENYSDPQVLGEFVLKDMTSVIDKLFPEGSAPDPLDQDAFEHEQFARSRAKVHIGRKEYFDKLDEHARSEGQPLVVLGESGSGKSALLSTWALNYKETHPDELVIMHFIGATPYSADWMAMLRRIMGDLKRHFDIKDEIPDNTEELKETFAEWLYVASVRGKLVLLFDALNQLEDKDAAPDLAWIPPFIPEKVKMIVSTLPGRPLEEIKRRGWKSLRVEPLKKDERKELISEYLQQYSKKLTDNQKEVIVDAQQTANPLYLRALLEELRLYGDHFKIDERIKHYLSTDTIDDLYEKILERYEHDYERDRPGLVKETMSFIWAARRGLSEIELMEVLGAYELPLPHAHWSPLYLATKESLVSRSGLLNFSHDYFRKAVMDRYLSLEKNRNSYHERLADYFEKHDYIARKIDEFPWQLMKAEGWERLKNCITDFKIFDELYVEGKKYDLNNYWLKIGDRFDMGSAYSKAIQAFEQTNPEPLELLHYICRVSEYLYFNSRYKDAKPLMLRALDFGENALGHDHQGMVAILNNLAALYDEEGEHDKAEPFFRRAIAILEKEKGSEHPDVASCLNNLAFLEHNRGNLEEARELFYRSLEIWEKKFGSAHPYVAISLDNIASLLLSHEEAVDIYSTKFLHLNIKDEYQEAELMLRMALDIKEKAFGVDNPSIVPTLNNFAYALIKQGKYKDASSLLMNALRILERAFGPSHANIAATLDLLVEACGRSGKIEEGMSYAERSIAIKDKEFGKSHRYTKNIGRKRRQLLTRKLDDQLLSAQTRRERDDQISEAVSKMMLPIARLLEWSGLVADGRTLPLLTLINSILAWKLVISFFSSIRSSLVFIFFGMITLLLLGRIIARIREKASILSFSLANRVKLRFNISLKALMLVKGIAMLVYLLTLVLGISLIVSDFPIWIGVLYIGGLVGTAFVYAIDKIVSRNFKE